MGDEIDDLLDDLLVDAFGDNEQLTAIEARFADSARFPFTARVVGVNVEVTKVVFEGDERRGLTAVCRRDGEVHRVSLADLTPGVVTVETARLLGAYRRWLGVPVPETVWSPTAAPSWTYRPVSGREIRITRPLLLSPMGTWDPADHFWGDDGDTELDPLLQAVIAAGPRPQFEMEQVIPGIDPDGWDWDPVTDAADYHQQGLNREATRILRDLIDQDGRCVDAWVHLGNIAFDTRGPGAAVELYDTAVSIAEQSLHDDFTGVLPRGLVDNRPFHRALHGLGPAVRLAPAAMG